MHVQIPLEELYKTSNYKDEKEDEVDADELNDYQKTHGV